MTDHAEICRINADGTTTYHWDNIEAEAQRWQPGCDGLSVYLSKLLLPLRPSREWIGLTDEEVESVNHVSLNAVDWDSYEVFQPSVKDFARALDALLKEKNS